MIRIKTDRPPAPRTPPLPLQGGACTFILLNNPDNTAYALPREINVTRRVTVMGHPAYLPTIDAGGGGAVRAFHVLVRKERSPWV